MGKCKFLFPNKNAPVFFVKIFNSYINYQARHISAEHNMETHKMY